MKPEELREKALEKANYLEKIAYNDNCNCLLMPAFQAAMQCIEECDKVLAFRNEEQAAERVSFWCNKLGLKG